MAVRTIRFNKQEESILDRVLDHYGADFSTCGKTLLFDKIEDLRDIAAVKRIREPKRSEYLSSDDIDSMFAGK